MKLIHKLCLEPEDFKKLKEKAAKSGFNGRGAVSHYITKICKEDICFLDENVKALLQTIWNKAL